MSTRCKGSQQSLDKNIVMPYPASNHKFNILGNVTHDQKEKKIIQQKQT